MNSEVEKLLLVLNIKAEPYETKYVLQIQYQMMPKRKIIIPKSQILKFYKAKLVNKLSVYGKVQVIHYLANELKVYK